MADTKTSAEAAAAALTGTEIWTGVQGVGNVKISANQMVTFALAQPTLSPSYLNLTLAGLLTESAADALTAHAGGGQGSALALTLEVNRITTVATAGDSVKLPAAAPGLTIVVINSGANPMQVYGAGTDTINDVATATGISQMPNSMVEYACTVAGKWYTDGLGMGFSGGLPTESFADSLTAHAGGGQGSALLLSAKLNRVTVVATAGDSVKLPVSAPGLEVVIINTAALPMQVFGSGTDTINGVASATGISQLPNSVYFYVCTAAGVWQVDGLGAGYSGQYPTVSAADALTAHAGGGQASALQLTASINRITTVGTAADSVKLPASAPGMQITVINAAASNSLQVFGTNPDTINGVATGTGVPLAAGKTASYYCTVAGAWHAILSA